MRQVLIGICDDQPEVLRELQKMICSLCEELHLSCEICAFSSGQELLEKVNELCAVFLDIEMPYMDGIELGKKIRERNSKCKIVMATGKMERFKEAFRIQAIRFVTKPFVREEVGEALKAAVENTFFSKTVEVYCQRNKYEFSEEEVMYIKAYNGSSELYVDGKRFRKDSSLDELEAILDKRLFVRISREVIVNLRWVQAYKEGQIRLKEECFFVSRRRRKDFERRYIEYDLKYRKEFG